MSSKSLETPHSSMDSEFSLRLLIPIRPYWELTQDFMGDRRYVREGGKSHEKKKLGTTETPSVA